MRIGSFNIEKNGLSSTEIKQSQVDTFIDNCCSNSHWDADLVFICEVHSGQLANYRSHLGDRYPSYNVWAFEGGYSNGYIVMAKAFQCIEVVAQGNLRGLNRELIAAHATSVGGYTGYIFLAHFKSGQTNLTKSQLLNCTALDGNWVVTGDLNFDYNNLSSLNPPGIGYECWNGQSTQAKGGILDWVLGSPNVQVTPVDITAMANDFDMSGPDHRPILFDIRA
ncbi:endonuclease/exonuclease/phosphatase family protein [Pseudomonas sp. Q1-7]|uniref:endonuclease/exonuclease/phosphatase family protein n=1 Tax=Pseudomonas sp. Q1-7 TaxID=3020843 RepID=UPI002300BE62|nr:endonuclease/exonuclease/phosphatase family protein [Pseudomonas sp. Q1-7]